MDTASVATDAAKAKVREMKEGVGGTWDKLEQVFEARVARALAKLGVHTQSDVERLTERVDALAAAVNELIRTGAGAVPKAKAVRRAAGNAETMKVPGAAKKAASKKPAAAKKPAKRAARSKDAS